MSIVETFIHAGEESPTMRAIADGPALHAWLEEELARRPGAMKPGPWARRTGVASDATTSRWASGESRPSMDILAKIADALNVSLVDVLLAAKAITPEEAGGRTPHPYEPISPEDAIMLDPTLPADAKQHLLGLLKLVRGPGVTFENHE